MKLDEKRLAGAFEAAGATLELLPGGAGKEWGKRLASKAGGAGDVAALLALLDAGDDRFNLGLALLLRAAAVDPPAALTVSSVADLPSFETDTSDYRVHHGDLVVSGDLELEESLLVTGNLVVEGTLDVSPEWLNVLVCGDVRARAATFGQDQIMIGGAFTVETLVAVMQGTVVVGGTFAAGLTIEWRGDIHAKTAAVKHRFIAEEGTRSKLEAVLVPEVFAADNGDNVLAVVPRVLQRVAKGEAIWR